MAETPSVRVFLALARRQALFLGVAEVDHDVAAVVGEIAAAGHVDLVASRIAALGNAVLALGQEAREIALVEEVDHARDGVRTVQRGGAAGQDVDPLDELGRDDVEIDGGRARQAGDDAAAVDQDQGAIRTEVAKIDRGDAARPRCRKAELVRLRAGVPKTGFSSSTS